MTGSVARVDARSGLLAWIGTLAAAAIVAGTVAVEVGRPVDLPPWPVVVLLGAALVVAGRLNLHFRHYGEIDSLDLFEAALTPVVFFLPPPAAVLLAALGKALSQLWMRMPPIKAAFNAAQWAASTGAAALVFAMVAPAGIDALDSLLALAAAMVAAAIVNVLAVAVLFRVLGPARPAGPSLLRPGYLLRTSAITAVSISTGLLVVLAATTAPAAVGLVLGPLLVARWAGVGYTLSYTDTQRMAGLQRATHALSAPADPRDGIPDYLTEVVRCFDARAAEVVLISGGTEVEVHRRWAAPADLRGQVSAGGGAGAGGPTSTAAGYQRWTAEATNADLLGALLDSPLPTSLTSRRTPQYADVLRAAGWRDCLAAPLTVDGERAGLLCVYDRSGSVDFEGSDEVILAALGREMAAALHRVRLLEVVLDERTKLARIVNGSTDGITALGLDGVVLTWNPAFTAITGYGEAEMLGGHGLQRLDPRDVTGRRVALAQWATATEPLPTDVQIRTAGGPVRWLSCSYAEATDPHHPALLILLARDVTELRRQQSLLGREAQVLDVLAGNATLEESLAAVSTMIEEEADGARVAIFLSDASDPLTLAAAAPLPAHLEQQLHARLGAVTEARWAESARTFEPVVLSSPVSDPDPSAAAPAPSASRCLWAMPIRLDGDSRQAGILTAGFSTERRPTDTDRALLRTAARLAASALSRHQARQELTHQASHDPLTGLPNRAVFLTHCARALERAERDHTLVAVMFLDLDRFKFVNDSLGHDAGDQVLMAVADRLRTVVRPDDTVARFGGDEFTILCQRIGDMEQARLVAERVQQVFTRSFTVRGSEVFETASIGISLGRGSSVANDLVENADAAMYRAKARGGNCYEFFNAALRRRAQVRLGTYVALRNAVDRHEFEVVYQPIISLREGGLAGVEALVRWRHPTDGLLPPSAFIDIAEETGLIVPIGAQVLHESLHQLRQWQRTMLAPPRLRMNVNMSARQFAQPDLVQMIERALHDTRTAPGELCLEITESVLVLETRSVQTAVGRLKALGVGLAIDDFGTGYSSLKNLRQLPVDQLKVDRSFVAGMLDGREDAAIVSAVIHLGHELGLTVVAEGIETVDQCDRLRHLQCDEAQGFHLGRPLEPAEVMAIVNSGGPPTTPVPAPG